MSHAVSVVVDKTALVRLAPICSTKCGRSKRSIHSSSECSNHAGRKGPKENSITILATHAFEDIEDVASLSKTGNVFFIGKQLGDYSKIVAHAKLSANGADAIGHIKTAPGRFSQFVMVIGTGPDQVVEIVQHELGPLMLWILTTNADERNARSVVSMYHPEWSEIQVNSWLAQRYPRGLTAVGLREIDETLLQAAA